MDALDQLGFGRRADQEGQLLEGLLLGEGVEWKPAEPRGAAYPCQPLGRRVRSCPVLCPPRPQDRHTGATREEGLHQVEGGGICPVEVFDEQRQRTCRCQRLEHLRRSSEHPVACLVVGRRDVSVVNQLGKQRRKRRPDERRAVRQGLLEPQPLVDVQQPTESIRDRHERHLCGERQAAPDRDERVGGRRGGGDELGLAHPGFAGDEEEAGAGLEVVSYGGQLGPASCDPRSGREVADRVGGARRRDPEVVELGAVSVHGFNEQLERAPWRERGRGEHLGDGGVGDTGLAGEGAQGGPAGAVVEVVQGRDEVAVRAGGEVGPGERAHRVPAAVAAIASDSGTCSRASVAARLSSRAATVPCPSRKAPGLRATGSTPRRGAGRACPKQRLRRSSARPPRCRPRGPARRANGHRVLDRRQGGVVVRTTRARTCRQEAGNEAS